MTPVSPLVSLPCTACDMRIMYYSNAQNHNEMYYSNAQYHYEMYYSNAQSRNDPWTGVWTNHPGLIFLAPINHISTEIIVTLTK